MFNKTYFLLLETQLSQVCWRRNLNRQELCEEWKVTFSARRHFFLTASLATKLNIYFSAGTALLNHQSPFYKTLMTSSKAVSINTFDRNFQHTSILLPASNRSLLKSLRYPHGCTRRMISLQQTFTTALFTSMPQSTVSRFKPEDSSLVLWTNDTKYPLQCQTPILSISLTSRSVKTKLA